MTQTPVQPSPQPPVAKKIPALRTHHGDAFEDNYEWLRDKESAEVVELLKAENAYQESVTAHQEPLRGKIAVGVVHTVKHARTRSRKPWAGYTVW